MKKNLLIFVICLFGFNFLKANASSSSLDFLNKYQEATIHFLDGTSIKGYGKIIGSAVISNGKYKIKFKVSKDSKPDVWTDLMVKGITFHYEFESISFLYVKLSGKPYPRLLQLVEEGAVSLYIEVESYWVTSGFNSQTGFPINNRKEVEISYFLKHKQDDKTLILSTTNSQFGTFKTIFFNFKKKVKEYFNDCEGIINKLDSGDFNRSTIPEIVYYYNDFCAELE